MNKKIRFEKPQLFIYSLGLGFLVQFPIAYIGVLFSRSINNLTASEFPFSKILSPELGSAFLFGIVQATIAIFLFWIFIRWVATTAEKAGRSYLAFMLLAIFLPVIAWIIVILFKKPETPTSST